MPKGTKAQFISPAMLAEIKADLQGLSQLEPGAKSIRDAVEELMPIIRGCRARGHSWKRIHESFSRVEGLSAASLRKYAYELDPALKEPVKNIMPKVSKPPSVRPASTPPAVRPASTLPAVRPESAPKAQVPKAPANAKKVSF